VLKKGTREPEKKGRRSFPFSVKGQVDAGRICSPGERGKRGNSRGTMESLRILQKYLQKKVRQIVFRKGKKVGGRHTGEGHSSIVRTCKKPSAWKKDDALKKEEKRLRKPSVTKTQSASNK